MTFQEQLNAYIDTLNCTARQLAEASGLSPAVISRYRSGDREPGAESPQLDALCQALESLAVQAGLVSPTRLEARAALSAALASPEPDDGALAENLNALMEALDVSSGEVARALNYDASYISRVRSGNRRPADRQAFADKLCAYLARRCARPEQAEALSRLTGVDAARLADAAARQAAMTDFLLRPAARRPTPAADFLEKLDEFDLAAYIRSIRFDELKVPSVPFAPVRSRAYSGTEGRKAAELAFLKATVLSRSMEDVFMCCDMPMEKLAGDIDFGKKWMLGIAMMLKKGLRLQIIHDLNRPFNEMMLGLESWIPLYMTGQISPWALQKPQNGVYCHMTYVSGAAALHGECMAGYEEEGRFALSGRREELEYQRLRSRRLLKKAQPVMDIYREDAREAFMAFLAAEADAPGPWRSVLTAPPLYTLPEEILGGILRRGGASDDEAEALKAHVRRDRERFNAIVAQAPVRDEIHLLEEAEFAAHPALLPLAGAFCERDFPYTYAEYRAHLDATLDRAGREVNYTVELTRKRAFRNLQIVMREGEWVLLSKQKSPAIHFVIRQRQLQRAIENMALPVVE